MSDLDQEMMLWQEQNVAQIRAAFVARYGDSQGFVRITDPDVIRAAWGPRRVSSRRRGMDLYAYPKEVGCAYSLWLAWFDRPSDSAGVVIAKKKAQARIDAALGRVSGDLEISEPEPRRAISDEEIEDMLAERADLRAARQFEDADKIRDYLVARGVVVHDRKLPT